LPARALEKLAAQLGEVAGAPTALERPANSEHGDFATNAALQLAPERKRPPREIAEELAAQASGLELVERAEVASPGSTRPALLGGRPPFRHSANREREPAAVAE
jgi:arginyl-tRNA synthetase